MKLVRWSAHALKNLADREIPRSEAEKTVSEPEFIAESGPSRHILMRRYVDSRHGQTMLIRAVAEETKEEIVVITVYSTSKIDKYMRGMTP